jgi:hypothetical protein
VSSAETMFHLKTFIHPCTFYLYCNLTSQSNQRFMSKGLGIGTAKLHNVLYEGWTYLNVRILNNSR